MHSLKHIEISEIMEPNISENWHVGMAVLIARYTKLQNMVIGKAESVFRDEAKIWLLHKAAAKRETDKNAVKVSITLDLGLCLKVPKRLVISMTKVVMTGFEEDEDENQGAGDASCPYATPVKRSSKRVIPKSSEKEVDSLPKKLLQRLTPKFLRKKKDKNEKDSISECVSQIEKCGDYAFTKALDEALTKETAV